MTGDCLVGVGHVKLGLEKLEDSPTRLQAEAPGLLSPRRLQTLRK